MRVEPEESYLPNPVLHIAMRLSRMKQQLMTCYELLFAKAARELSDRCSDIAVRFGRTKIRIRIGLLTMSSTAPVYALPKDRVKIARASNSLRVSEVSQSSRSDNRLAVDFQFSFFTYIVR